MKIIIQQQQQQKNMELWQNMEDRMQHAICFTFSKKRENQFEKKNLHFKAIK